MNFIRYSAGARIMSQTNSLDAILSSLTPEQRAALEPHLAGKSKSKSTNRRTIRDDQGPITLAIGEKGGVCIYGLQRHPVTLYAPQMLRFIRCAKDIAEFIADHKDQLRWVKPDKTADKPAEAVKAPESTSAPAANTQTPAPRNIPGTPNAKRVA